MNIRGNFVAESIAPLLPIRLELRFGARRRILVRGHDRGCEGRDGRANRPHNCSGSTNTKQNQGSATTHASSAFQQGSEVRVGGTAVQSRAGNGDNYNI